MIRHMIFWNLAPTITPTNKLAVISKIKKKYYEMADKIDGLAAVSIDADLGFGTHDLGLYCEFESWTALRNYYAHPLCMDFMAKTENILFDRRCVDLEVQ